MPQRYQRKWHARSTRKRRVRHRLPAEPLTLYSATTAIPCPYENAERAQRFAEFLVTWGCRKIERRVPFADSEAFYH
eukprot:3011586-Amphidinium_carterae.1